MKYEDIKIGQREVLSHTVTQTDIDKFVDLTGDDNKLHVDKDFAAKTSFKKPVVHGMLGASFISTLIGTKLPGDGALWFSQTLDFLLPVRVNDNIKVTAEVTKKIDNEHIVELKIEIVNQNKQIVTRGISKVKVIEQKKNTDNEKTATTSIVRPKVALVVGATGGIGAATCKALADNGFEVVMHYNSNKQKALDLLKELTDNNRKAHIVSGDVKNENDIVNIVNFALRHCGYIDVFVNCASTSIAPIQFQNLEWQDFVEQFNLNIQINLSFIQKILPEMIVHKFGRFITIGTVFSNKPNPKLAHYVTAKSALEGFTKAAALEMAPNGITFNMVSPSMLNTDLTSEIPEKVKLINAAQTPIRRLAIAEDVANAIAFLASEKSGFITGENVRVNGGQVMI